MRFSARGIIAALVTPLTDSYTLSERGLRSLIDYQIKGGVHGLFIAGTSGEFYLSREERRDAFEICIDEAGGRVPSMQESMASPPWRQSPMPDYQARGADAISVLTPMFVSLTQEELATMQRLLHQHLPYYFTTT